MTPSRAEVGAVALHVCVLQTTVPPNASVALLHSSTPEHHPWFSRYHLRSPSSESTDVITGTCHLSQSILL